MSDNKVKTTRSGITKTGVNPASFPLGSEQSRAAARLLLASRAGGNTKDPRTVALESMIPDERAIVEQVLAARERGESGPNAPEVWRAMNHYLQALVKATPTTPFDSLSIAETLRRCREEAASRKEPEPEIIPEEQ